MNYNYISTAITLYYTCAICSWFFKFSFDNLKLFSFLSMHRRTSVRSFLNEFQHSLSSLKNLKLKSECECKGCKIQILHSMLCNFALSVVKAFDTKENWETIFLGFILANPTVFIYIPPLWASEVQGIVSRNISLCRKISHLKFFYPLEMDRKLHLNSFFENSYGVGSISKFEYCGKEYPY